MHNWQQHFETCLYSNKLLEKVSLKNTTAKNPVDIEQLKKAIYYARRYHGNQMRQSGEPYYSHPLEVAYMVSDYLFTTSGLVVAVLHDTIEDTELTKQMIAEIFDQSIADQVYDLTRIKPQGKITSAQMIENLWIEQKYDMVLIKLFDRLHNIQTVGAKSPEKAKKTINETLKYFLVLSELMELHGFSDHLYKACYDANINAGFIDELSVMFDNPSELPSLPVS